MRVSNELGEDLDRCTELSKAAVVMWDVRIHAIHPRFVCTHTGEAVRVVNKKKTSRFIFLLFSLIDRDSLGIVPVSSE